ncbi:MAG: NAD-dependent epimerase/dehydratase family protein [Luteibaculaceae bacterium]
MANILVTGGAGNVGSALVKKLLENSGNTVIVADNLATGSIDKVPFKNSPNFKFIKCDVNEYRDIAEIMLAWRFDYVFHYAAVVGVQRTQDNPVAVLRDIDGLKNVLNLSKNTGVKRFFFSSSSEVYGEPVELPQHEETTPLNSRVPYAVVKNVGESFCKSYQKEYGLNYTIFRFFNTYGPNQSKDFVVARFLSQALRNEDITIYGDGTQTRTFCYVDDNVETCVRALYENKVVNDVINIGGDELWHIKDLAKEIIRITGSQSKLIHLPPLPEGDMTRRQPDNSKMRKILGRDLITLEEGIKKMLENPHFLYA